MTPEDAIKNIEIAIAEVEWEYPMEYAVAFEAAIEALEKQIAKKPKKTRDGNLACQCGLVVQTGFKRHNRYYCDICGQAIDWSEEE